MQSKFLATALMGSAALWSQSAAAQSDVPKQTVTYENKVIFSDIGDSAIPPVTFGAKDWKTTFLWSGMEPFASGSLSVAGNSTTYDSFLRAECFPGDGTKVGFGAILSFLVGPVVKIAEDAVTSALDKELKRYSAEYSGSNQAAFYKAGAGPEPAPAWRCFRFIRTRTVKTEGDSQEVKSIDLDILGQIESDQKGGGVRVRPLRTFMMRPTAKGSRVGLAASIKLQAIWRDGNEGKSTTVFDYPFLDMKYNRTKAGTWLTGKQAAPEPFYNWQKDAKGDPVPGRFAEFEKLPMLPYVPWGNTRPDRTVADVTIKVAEAGDGDGKAFLKGLIKLFGASKDDIGTLLTKAGQNLVNPPEKEKPADPKVTCSQLQTDGSWQTVDGKCTPTTGS